MLLSFFKCPLSFDIGWTDQSTGCCTNAVNKKMSMATNLMNCGPVILEILWLICMGGDCREANIHSVLDKGHSLGGSSIASL